MTRSIQQPTFANWDRKATLLGGVGRAQERSSVSLSSTVFGMGPSSENETTPRPGTSLSRRTVTRTTVLPRRNARSNALAAQEQPRYERLKTLGQGAMGRVELVRDNDIQRTVAVKQLLSEHLTDTDLLRFTDEIRVVGQLEHPSIVPIYDVDSGEGGEIRLVMKHLQGETMEDAIDRLRAGDEDYRKRFTPEYRVRLFLNVLDAIRYAHSKGILHRDIKPANIMIGPFGEVTVMDWGIAKPLTKRDGATLDALGKTALQTDGHHLLDAQSGALAGTPLYMSPEQAAGLNAELDERSDVYTLVVVLYEWLVLWHPLQDKASVHDVLTAIVLSDYDPQSLVGPAQRAQIPMEYLWIILRGLVRDREKRFQSVEEFEEALKGALDGNIVVQCPITLAKSYAHDFTHWVDRNPQKYIFAFRAMKIFAIATAGAALVAVFAMLLVALR